MKTLTLLATAASMTVTAFAGTTAEVMTPTPPPAPTLGGWFVGGTYGQANVGHNGEDLLPGYNVDDVDFDLYTLQVGKDLGMQVLGCDLAAYLEVGIADGDTTVSDQSDSLGVDVQLVPITLNVKLERAIYGPISAYLTGGVGYAFSEISGDGESENDGGFYAQASAGLLYNINPQWEVFAGARWMYLDDVKFGGIADGLNLDNDFAWEVGVRYNF